MGIIRLASVVPKKQICYFFCDGIHRGPQRPTIVDSSYRHTWMLVR